MRGVAVPRHTQRFSFEALCSAVGCGELLCVWAVEAAVRIFRDSDSGDEPPTVTVSHRAKVERPPDLVCECGSCCANDSYGSDEHLKTEQAPGLPLRLRAPASAVFNFCYRTVTRRILHSSSIL